MPLVLCNLGQLTAGEELTWSTSILIITNRTNVPAMPGEGYLRRVWQQRIEAEFAEPPLV
jgi:hypothetical protein